MNKAGLTGFLFLIASTGCVTSSTTGSSPTTATGVLSEATVISNVGFATPESVLYDPSADIYLVSNINGHPTAFDDNGFIARVSPDGTLQNLKWIAGESEEFTLHAPKGMALVGEVLYVADIDHVRMFHRTTGVALGSVRIEGATFLNDIAPNGSGGILVSDSGLNADFSPSGTDTIYMMDGAGVVSTLTSGIELNRPNGLAVNGDAVWNVSFGGKEVRKLSHAGVVLERFEAPAGSLDGIEVLPNGTILISSWGSQSVYRLLPDGTFEALVENVEAAADIGVDTRRNRILVPLFKNDAIHIAPLN
jgi:hypothetical protein